MLRAGLAMVMAMVLGLVSGQAARAQTAPSVISAASKAMGADKLNAIRLYGSAANYTVGQSNRAGGPWPRTNLNDYVRTIDFTRPATKATAVTWQSPVQGGPAVQGAYVQAANPETPAWAQQLEIWTSPWGFLKGAAQNRAVLSNRTVGRRAYRVLTWTTPMKSPGGLPYRVVGYIGPQNLVERVDTWVENPVFGDLAVERRYTDYRDLDGIKFPQTIRETRDGQHSFDAYLLGFEANPANLQQLLAPAGPPPNFPPYQGPASEKLAEGVYRINGPYNSLAIEFRDYILLFEPGPQNEARARAVIAEAKRLIPNKPIRYGVISHHHFDHTGGLSGVVGEGITIVTPQVNKAFLEHTLGGPRTLAPDAIAKSGRRPVIEGFTGDKRVFQDATRTFEVHVIKGLPHADGLVIGWLPKEKILVYADMFNLPSPNEPVPNPPVVGTQVFLANLERLKLEPERILSVHTLNPDRLTSMADIRASLGRPAPGR
jgi:glyoxylase-like metal-dependent hydrolase (beta-lactamase superfamily II)